jgi:hypothetical protein
MNLTTYNKLIATQTKIADEIRALNVKYEELTHTVAKAHKEIRNTVESTYLKGKTSAIMKLNGRVLKLRINARQRGDSVAVIEDGKDIAWFGNAYAAEFAFATGQI